MTESGSRSLTPDDYESLIERLREAVDAAIPRNATVLVVSRGDDELLHIGARRGLHFPQDEFGGYPGYHPADSAAAIAALEDMRVRGGDYLVLPSTSFWWLDYYKDLRDHLDRNYPAIVSTPDCMIFELATAGVQAPPGDADSSLVSAATSSRRLAEPLTELLRALLPEDARIAVAATGGGGLPFSNCTTVLPDGRGPAALLKQLRGSGAQFLVVPAPAREHLHDGTEPADALPGWRLVTSQRDLGDVYERDPGDAPQDQTAIERLGRRIRNFFLPALHAWRDRSRR
jgi:hypothetical protein